MRRILLIIAVAICAASSANALAGPADAYRQAINIAAGGDERAAIAALDALATALPADDIWRARARTAGALLSMRMRRSALVPAGAGPQLALADAYVADHPLLPDAVRWPATALAVLLPGAGHAWQGRWRDAATAAMMVWPMLLLTFWAARRRMGPVTLFFALITAWLWSGTVFSSLSLAERGTLESYLAWWQHLWQASGLPGRPW